MKRLNVVRLVDEKIAEQDFYIQGIERRVSELETRFDKLVELLAKCPALPNDVQCFLPIPF